MIRHAIQHLVEHARQRREFIRVYGRERGLVEFSVASRSRNLHPEDSRRILAEALAFGRAHGKSAAEFRQFLQSLLETDGGVPQ